MTRVVVTSWMTARGPRCGPRHPAAPRHGPGSRADAFGVEDHLARAAQRRMRALAAGQGDPARLVHGAGERAFDVDNLDRALRLGTGVKLLVPGVESGLQPLQRGFGDLEEHDGQPAFMHLPTERMPGLRRMPTWSSVKPSEDRSSRPRASQPLEQPVQPRRGFGALQPHRAGGQVVVLVRHAIRRPAFRCRCSRAPCWAAPPRHLCPTWDRRLSGTPAPFHLRARSRGSA